MREFEEQAIKLKPGEKASSQIKRHLSRSPDRIQVYGLLPANLASELNGIKKSVVSLDNVRSEIIEQEDDDERTLHLEGNIKVFRQPIGDFRVGLVNKAEDSITFDYHDVNVSKLNVQPWVETITRGGDGYIRRTISDIVAVGDVTGLYIGKEYLLCEMTRKNRPRSS